MDMRDRRHWVLLYRMEDEDSVAFAQAYRDHHGLSDLQILGLKDIPGTAMIDEASYDDMKVQVQSLIQHNGQSPRGIILGYGMPIKVELDAGTIASLCSLLTDMTDNAVLVNNPGYLHAETVDELPDRGSIPVAGHYLVADLSVERYEDAIMLMQKAGDLGHQAIDGVEVSHLSADRDRIAFSAMGWLNLMEWQSSTAAQSLALPFFERENSTSLGDSIEIYGAGSSTTTDSEDYDPPSEGTLRALWWDMRDGHAEVGQLAVSPCELAIQHGYVYSIGWVDSPLADSLIDPMSFFTALRYWATMAEAIYLYSPHFHHGLRVIGDPLSGIPFPQSMTTVRHADDRRLLKIFPKIEPELFDLSGLLSEGDHRILLQKSDDYGVLSVEKELELHFDAQARAWLNTCPVGQLSAHQVSGSEIQLSWALASEGSWRWPDRFEVIDLQTGELVKTVNARGDEAFYDTLLGPFELGKTLQVGVQSAREDFYSPMKTLQIVMDIERGAVA